MNDGKMKNFGENVRRTAEDVGDKIYDGFSTVKAKVQNWDKRTKRRVAAIGAAGAIALGAAAYAHKPVDKNVENEGPSISSSYMVDRNEFGIKNLEGAGICRVANVGSDGLRIRDGAGVDSNVIGHLKSGDLVVYIWPHEDELGNKWNRVKVNGIEGYVASEYNGKEYLTDFKMFDNFEIVKPINGKANLCDESGHSVGELSGKAIVLDSCKGINDNSDKGRRLIVAKVDENDDVDLDNIYYVDSSAVATEKRGYCYTEYDGFYQSPAIVQTNLGGLNLRSKPGFGAESNVVCRIADGEFVFMDTRETIYLNGLPWCKVEVNGQSGYACCGMDENVYLNPINCSCFRVDDDNPDVIDNHGVVNVRNASHEKIDEITSGTNLYYYDDTDDSYYIHVYYQEKGDDGQEIWKDGYIKFSLLKRIGYNNGLKFNENLIPQVATK